MVKIPVLRWGQPFESIELDNVIHFGTGETLAKVSQAIGAACPRRAESVCES